MPLEEGAAEDMPAYRGCIFGVVDEGQSKVV